MFSPHYVILLANLPALCLRTGPHWLPRHGDAARPEAPGRACLLLGLPHAHDAEPGAQRGEDGQGRAGRGFTISMYVVIKILFL